MKTFTNDPQILQNVIMRQNYKFKPQDHSTKQPTRVLYLYINRSY